MYSCTGCGHGNVHRSEKGARLAHKMQVGPCMHSCGNTATKGLSWPNFWANPASFSLGGHGNGLRRPWRAWIPLKSSPAPPLVPAEDAKSSGCAWPRAARSCMHRPVYILSDSL
jgi:hypothetical protein